MAAASDQIRQMVNFILQEAHEKANEIRVKVCFIYYS
jgi:V-type H+-transporting ATPase subunit E